MTSESALDWRAPAPATSLGLARVHGADELTYFRLARLLERAGLRAGRNSDGGGDDGRSESTLELVVAMGPVDWKAVVKLRRRADTVVLTGEPSAIGERHALELGAVGYLPLHLGDEALCRALGAIARQQAGFSRTVLGQWLRDQTPRIRPLDPIPLTRRQEQILERIARGEADKQIAQHLGIATATVQKHVQVLLRRLGVRNRAAAVRFARVPKADDRT